MHAEYCSTIKDCTLVVYSYTEYIDIRIATDVRSYTYSFYRVDTEFNNQRVFQ